MLFFLIQNHGEYTEPTLDSFNENISDFTKLLLSGKIKWVVPKEKFQLIYFNDICWDCGNDIRQICGYLSWDAETSNSVPHVSNILKRLKEWLRNNILNINGLNSIDSVEGIKGNAPKFPYCNICYHCKAPQTNHYLIEKMNKENGLKHIDIEYDLPLARGKWSLAI